VYLLTGCWYHRQMLKNGAAALETPERASTGLAVPRWIFGRPILMLRRILPIRARSTPRRDVRGLTAEMEMIGMLGCVIRVSTYALVNRL